MFGTSEILDDAWIFDLTNRAPGVCPWISLPSTGEIRYSAAMAWDAANARFVLSGGYTGNSTEVGATDAVVTASPAQLAAGSGWSTLASLPDIEYRSSSLSDAEGSQPEFYPDMMCAGGPREVPCTLSSGTLAAMVAGAFYDDDVTAAFCVDGKFDAETYVTGWAWALPCEDTYECVPDVGDPTSKANTVYGEACAEDPACTDSEWFSAWDAVNQPGLAEHGMVVNPTTGDLVVAMGTTGCAGDCSYWDDLSALDADTDDARAMANSDPIIAISGSSATLTNGVHSATIPADEFPTTSSYGRRAAATAPVGLQWDYSNRSLGGSPSLFAYGGTLGQDLGKGRQHQLICENDEGDNMAVCDDFCIHLKSSWIEGDPAFTGANDGMVTGGHTVSVLDAAGTAWTGQGDPGGANYAAATWFGGDQVAVWGGSDEAGDSDDLFIWDTVSQGVSVYADNRPWGPRSGGSAAYDPIEQTAFFFGGSADSEVYGYTADPITAGQDANLTVGRWASGVVEPGKLDAGISYDGTNWGASGEFGLQLECPEATDCFAHDVSIIVAAETLAELVSIWVKVTYADSATEYDLTPYLFTVLGAGYSRVDVRVPRVLTDGMAVHVEAGWTAGVATRAAFGGCREYNRRLGTLCSYQTGNPPTDGAPDERTTVVLLKGTPLYPAALTDTHVELTTTYTLPTGWQGVAPGDTESPGTSFSTVTPVQYTDKAAEPTVLLASNGLTWLQSVATATGDEIHVWGDSGIAYTAGTDNDYPIRTTGNDSPGADVNWLETTVAPFPEGDRHLIVLRRSEAQDRPTGLWLGGWAPPGLHFAFRYGADGTADVGLRSTVIHELAHGVLSPQEIMRDVRSARWLLEGPATLLEWARLPLAPAGTLVPAPPVNGREVMYYVAQQLALDTCAPDLGDLVADERARVRYDYGAYTFAQLYWTYRASGRSDTEFWSKFISYLESTSEVDAYSISQFITVDLGLPDFYRQWVKKDRVGTPLLAITALYPDTSSCTDTGLCDPAGVEVQISQVQIHQITAANGCPTNAELFTNVPYFFRCYTPETASSLPLEGCVNGWTDFDSEVPSVSSAATESRYLPTNSAYEGIAPFPLELQLLSNDAMLPGSLPFAGYRNTADGGRKRVFRLCDTPTDPACGTDVDGDLFQSRADCDDADITVNMGASPLPLDQPDNNCDGWGEQ